MFISRDKSGTYLLSSLKPEKMNCHWKSPNSCYMIINSNFGEQLFPNITWKNDPVEINLTIENLAGDFLKF